MGPAAGRRTKARPKRLNGLFYLPELILNASTGQIRRLGGKFEIKHRRLISTVIYAEKQGEVIIKNYLILHAGGA